MRSTQPAAESGTAALPDGVGAAEPTGTGALSKAGGALVDGAGALPDGVGGAGSACAVAADKSKSQARFTGGSYGRGARTNRAAA